MSDFYNIEEGLGLTKIHNVQHRLQLRYHSNDAISYLNQWSIILHWDTSLTSLHLVQGAGLQYWVDCCTTTIENKWWLQDT